MDDGLLDHPVLLVLHIVEVTEDMENTTSLGKKEFAVLSKKIKTNYLNIKCYIRKQYTFVLSRIVQIIRLLN